ncbi:MAG: ABC transporter permease [Actinobacteria bacterium]|nr:ABC transporter permease [Actinomycetota bacterium]
MGVIEDEIPATPPVPGTQLDVVADKRAARREKARLFITSPSALIGLGIILFWIICAVLGSHITPHDPFRTDALSHEAPFTDGYYFGARDVLIAAPLAAIIGVVSGSMLGLLMGYYRGILDDILGRLIEAFLVLPLTLVGLLALSAAPEDWSIIPGIESSTQTVILVVGLLFTPIVARTVRAAVLAERENDYVQAAKLRGENGLYIMTREILPNVMSPIVVEFTVRIGYAIFAIATLSFLGVGIQEPTPDWGLMIAQEYRLVIGGYWWVTVFPALAIASLVIAVNLIADRLQEVMEL